MHFQDETVIGSRILLMAPNASADTSAETRWMTIVGVVGTPARVGVRGIRSGRRLVPNRGDPPEDVRVARSASGPAAAAAFVQDQIRALDADLPLYQVSTVDEAGSLTMAATDIGSMFAIFASIAMLLATCGLYAVTAYAVSRRTREIGYG